MNWYSSILVLLFISSPVLPNINAVAEVIEVIGNVTVKPISMNIVPGPAIGGRSLYGGDIIRSSKDSKIHFFLKVSNTQLTISGLSELRIDCNEKVCELKLNYGKIFSESPNIMQNKSFIITNTSEITLDGNELWINRSIAGKDEMYAIKGRASVFPAGDMEQYIEMGEMITITSEGKTAIREITKNMLPVHIYQRLKNNLNREPEKVPFTIMNYFTDDSSISTVFYKEKVKYSYY